MIPARWRLALAATGLVVVVAATGGWAIVVVDRTSRAAVEASLEDQLAAHALAVEAAIDARVGAARGLALAFQAGQPPEPWLGGAARALGFSGAAVRVEGALGWGEAPPGPSDVDLGPGEALARVVPGEAGPVLLVQLGLADGGALALWEPAAAVAPGAALGPARVWVVDASGGGVGAASPPGAPWAAADSGSSTGVVAFRDPVEGPVLAAWRWLPSRGVGVAVARAQADVRAASRPLRVAFGGLAAALVVCVGVVAAAAALAAQLTRRTDRAERAIEELGQYALVERVGKGSMGAVYKARHRLLRRPTAVKVLARADLPGAVERFEREVRLTSELTHPNTVHIYDYGQTADGRFYYAMEYLDGVDLRLLIERFGPQPPGRVIHLLLQVCGSLAEAHERGVVHRDIKPANVLLCERGGVADVVKVVDFGLVKGKGEEDPMDRATGVLLGTPIYLAPEVIGSPGAATPASDLYALGVVGFELLCGEPPFSGDMAAVLDGHRADTPIKPSSVLGRRVDVEVEAVLVRCLEKDPARRWPSARALAEALARCAAAGSWTQLDARRWWADAGLPARPSLTPGDDGGPPTLRVDLRAKGR